MCYECVMDVMDVLWMCYGCVMNVLWMCYECVMRVLWECYESVMKVLWMCYGCVLDVWGMLWLCEVCYGCVKDVWVMDEWWIFYIHLCKLYCNWYFNCNIVVVLWYNCYVNLCILFFRVFFNWPINIWPHDGVCVHFTYTSNPQQWRPMSFGVGSWCRVSVGSPADRRQTSDARQWCVSGPPGCAKDSTQQTASVTARRQETCSGLYLVFLNIWTLVVFVYIYLYGFRYMWHLTPDLSINVTEIWWTFMILDWDIANIFTWITRIFIVIVINVFYCHRVNQSLSTKEMIWLIRLLCICCNVYSVRMNVRVVCFSVFGFVWMGLCVWCLCY